MLPNINDLSASQLETLLRSMGQLPYRARQIMRWYYQGLATSFSEMTDLPAPLRQTLSARLSLTGLSLLNVKAAGDRQTFKALLELPDGKTIESALMLYEGSEASRERNTVCVSTQAGCPIGCPFCATGQQGFRRNLTAGEIVEQVLFFQRFLAGEHAGHENRRLVTNVVFMGMGEPLANYDSTLKALRTLTARDGMGLGARRITISTSGLVPQIKRLGREEMAVELAISLHAPTNTLRDRLVPVNKRYPLEMLISAARQYYNITGRRVTFEYALFKGINDSAQQAHELARLLHGLNCHVNLLAANPTPNAIFRAPARKQVLLFQQELTDKGILATLREPKGTDIHAACGQLRGNYPKNTPDRNVGA